MSLPLMMILQVFHLGLPCPHSSLGCLDQAFPWPASSFFFPMQIGFFFFFFFRSREAEKSLDATHPSYECLLSSFSTSACTPRARPTLTFFRSFSRTGRVVAAAAAAAVVLLPASPTGSPSSSASSSA